MASKTDAAAESLSRLSKIREEQERRALKGSGIGTFIQFCALLDVKLTLGQRTMAKVAFDKVKPDALDADEKEMFVKLFGDIKEIPSDCYSLLVLVIGARSGKTYLSALRMLHLALTVDLSTLAPGEEAFCIFVAPTLAQAMQAMRYVAGAINKVPALRAMLASKPSPQKIRLRRGSQVVAIEPRAAGAKGLQGRGMTIVSACLDEAAFFRDSDFAVSDEEVFSAIYLRLLPTSQMLIVSTPWTRSGLLFKKYEENFGHPLTAMCAHAPTLLMLDTERNRLVIEQSRREDPEKTEREYDAQFLSASVECFFDPNVIDNAVDMDLPVDTWREPSPGDMVKAGCDFGFSSDSSAMVVTHSRGGITYVAEVRERRPQKDMALKPSEVIRDFAEVSERHNIPYIMSDGHYKELVLEILSEYGINFLSAPNTPADAYIATRLLLHSGLLRIPNNARLKAQLRETRAKRTSGGLVQIVNPRTKGGGHGDLVSALVLAVYQACGERIPYADPDPNTPEGRLLLNERMREGRRAAQYTAAASEYGNDKWWQKKSGRSFRGKQRLN